MMRCILLLSLLLVVAVPALADPIDPDTDVLGFYFDEEATQVCTEMSPFGQTTLYVTLTHPSRDVIYGVEFGADWEGPLLVLAVSLECGGMIILPPPLDNFIVGWGSVCPLGEVSILARASLLYTGTAGEPVAFRLHGSSPSSLPGDLPVYLAADGELVQCRTPVANGEICAMINGDCGVVATESRRWGAVKSLYR